MGSISGADITRDAFLGGRVAALQPRRGYRAGIDPVFLAAAVEASAGQSVLELGCGVGVAALCLAARVPGVEVTGVEVQTAYAALARANGVAVVEADLRDLPPELRQRRFDHVMMNPPYFDRRAGSASSDPGRDTAFGGETPLADWLAVAGRRLASGGWLTLIQRVERLPEVLEGLTGFGSVTVAPLAAREGRAPERMLLRARKGGRGVFRLMAPFVLHDGPRHARDGEDYAPAARAILRDAQPFIWAT